MGVTVRLPVKAASAAISASMKSSFPRLCLTDLSGYVTSRTSMPDFVRWRISPLPYEPLHSKPTL